MDLKGIISISGMSGLYKIVATNKNGFIVESFHDKKRFPVSSAQRVSTLEDITIYTEDGDIPLKDVLKKLDEKAGKDIKPDPKAEPDQMRKDMEAVLPEYDKERVYNSDIKKLFSWYTILKESDFSFEDEPEMETEEETEVETETKRETKTKSESKKSTGKSAKKKESETVAKKKTKKVITKADEKPAKKKKEKPAAKSASKSKTTATKSTKGKTAKKAVSKKK
jgi:hypothetical protein